MTLRTPQSARRGDPPPESPPASRGAFRRAFWRLARTPSSTPQEWASLLRAVAPDSWLLRGGQLPQGGRCACQLAHNELSRLLAAFGDDDAPAGAPEPRAAAAAAAATAEPPAPAAVIPAAVPTRIRLNDPRLRQAPPEVQRACEAVRSLTPILTGLHARLKVEPRAEARAEILRRMERAAAARRKAWHIIDTWAAGLPDVQPS